MAPPPAEAPPAKVKTPPPLQWSRLPVTDYLCTRFGPDWERGKGRYPDTVKGRSFSNPFTLTVPPGHDLAFRIESKGSKSGEITYGASGWPAGATLDAKTGKFTWLVAGKASDTFLVTFEARSSGGEVLTWSMQVAIASEAEQLAFRAGAGGKTWPDCSAAWRDELRRGRPRPRWAPRRVRVDGVGRTKWRLSVHRAIFDAASWRR